MIVAGSVANKIRSDDVPVVIAATTRTQFKNLSAVIKLGVVIAIAPVVA